MSIYTTNNPNILRLPTQQPGIRDVTRTPAKPSTDSVPATSKSLAQPATSAEMLPSESSGAIEPPPGTDPALWSILSGEERAFFAKAGAKGPLTYGRAFSDMTSAHLPAPLGGRLDVKI